LTLYEAQVRRKPPYAVSCSLADQASEGSQTVAEDAMLLATLIVAINSRPVLNQPFTTRWLPCIVGTFFTELRIVIVRHKPSPISSHDP
jgi:hypothetical protein